MAHIRRLLDIVACTTSFGGGTSSSPRPNGRTGHKDSGSNDAEAAPENTSTESIPKPKISDKKSGSVSPGPQKWNPTKLENVSTGGDVGEKGDAAAAAIMCPPPRLGQFYDFFSFSHLTPPIQCEFYCFLELFYLCFFIR